MTACQDRWQGSRRAPWNDQNPQGRDPEASWWVSKNRRATIALQLTMFLDLRVVPLKVNYFCNISCYNITDSNYLMVHSWRGEDDWMYTRPRLPTFIRFNCYGWSIGISAACRMSATNIKKDVQWGKPTLDQKGKEQTMRWATPPQQWPGCIVLMIGPAAQHKGFTKYKYFVHIPCNILFFLIYFQ